MSQLAILRRLFQQLHEREIPYCHWKSNEHLDAALLGDTDLDILVDRDHARALYSILLDTGFKRFATVPFKAYPAVEDYLGFDLETGKIVHLHLHFRLTLGEKHLKGYRVPWEPHILADRILDRDAQVFTSSPEWELLLLVVREALKLRRRDLFKAVAGRGRFGKNSLKEFQWLKERVDNERLLRLAASQLGPECLPVFEAVVKADNPTVSQFRAFRRQASHRFRLWRSHRPLSANIRRWIREFYWAFGQIVKRFWRNRMPTWRVIPSGGVVIAFLGNDGSGKSTLTIIMSKWLSRKLDVTLVYFGSGDGANSPLLWPFKAAASVLKRKRVDRKASDTLSGSSSAASTHEVHGDHKAQRHHEARTPAAKASRATLVAKSLRALILARERKRKLRVIWKARNRGMIVLCDRFPQNQVVGYNDGPFLASLDPQSGFLKKLATWERTPYLWAEASPPDLVIKLNVSPDVASRRKPEVIPEIARKRIDAIKALQFPPHTRVVDIDADQPIDEVVRQVKQAIWEAL